MHGADREVIFPVSLIPSFEGCQRLYFVVHILSFGRRSAFGDIDISLHAEIDGFST